MKKKTLKNLDLEVYEEKLKNGLQVILIPYKEKKNYFITYATRFGSNITTFTPTDAKKEIKVPDGIAHFLEHKMFEQEAKEDPFKFFSKSGTTVNASTSFKSTKYFCYGTKDFLKNLNYLIEIINNPYYTDDNVEKEKGIIAEELKMYLDIPDFELEKKLRENIFQKHPIRIDIGGTIDEVNKIKKEDLYLCYNNFYSPNNMFILIAGNFDIDKTMKLIHEQLDNKQNLTKVKIKKIKEPKQVLKRNDEIKKSIEIPKIGMGIKISKSNLSIKDEVELDLYLSILISILFGSTSDFREKVTNEKLINNFYMDIETTEDNKVLMFTSSTNNPSELIKNIEKELENIHISEEEFERKKKVWIANEVKITDYIEAVANNIYDDLISYNKIIYNRVDLIRKMKLSKLENLIKEINFDNKAIVKMLPNNK